MVAISSTWYNGSYTITAKPIKFLELHYTIIQCLIIGVIELVIPLSTDFNHRNNKIIIYI